ncbi:ROK family protein [Pseudonocardia sp.]|uniref:ROK family protein n=1 Tax=Pseudonocardia sp. TaxID=60912 RepID=UPI002608C9A8|nr:ROK family protein [Pseudonocardia sp.]
MSTDEQPDALHTALARRIWRADPIVRLHHDPARESLVAQVVSAPAGVEITVSEHLIVDLDGADADAFPTTLYLGAVRSRPDSAAVAQAREILGEQVWATAGAMIDAGRHDVRDVALGTDDARALLAAWHRLADRLREPAMIGVEFSPGRLVAVLTDAHATVLDEAYLDLDGNEPDDVVAGVAALADELAGRHRGTPAETCPIGIQLGGPVNTERGWVEVYRKPRRGHDDESWMGVRLGELVERRTGRQAWIVNDADAFARWEATRGLGRTELVVVLVVRDGVGAKLVDHGQVLPYPMEIGNLMELGSDGAPARALEAASGINSIVDRVSRVTGDDIATIGEAADAAERSDVARAAFTSAGKVLARGIAAIQSVCGADRVVLVGPRALVDQERQAGQAFVKAARQIEEHLKYEGLWGASIVSRPTTGTFGARVVAWAALARMGSRMPSQGQRP